MLKVGFDRGVSRFSALLLLAACVGAPEAQHPQTQRPQALRGPGSHLSVILKRTASGLTVLETREVAQPLPRLRVPEPGPWHLVFRDARGEVLHETFMADATLGRGEFRVITDAGLEAIEPHHFARASAVFRVQLPVAEGTLTLDDGTELGTARISLPSH